MDKLKESGEEEADPRDIKGQKSLSDSYSFTYLPCAYYVPGGSECCMRENVLRLRIMYSDMVRMLRAHLWVCPFRNLD